jgi:hypothetical protein
VEQIVRPAREGRPLPTDLVRKFLEDDQSYGELSTASRKFQAFYKVHVILSGASLRAQSKDPYLSPDDA